MVEEIELSILVNASVLAVALALLAADMINIDQPKIKQEKKANLDKPYCSKTI